MFAQGHQKELDGVRASEDVGRHGIAALLIRESDLLLHCHDNSFTRSPRTAPFGKDSSTWFGPNRSS